MLPLLVLCLAGIALKRTVQQQDVAVTPEVEGKLYVEQVGQSLDAHGSRSQLVCQ